MDLRAHVTDGAGKFAPLTRRGWWDVGPDGLPVSFGSGSTRDITINPGETLGGVLALGEDYDLARPGIYKATVVWLNTASPGPLVAEPLVLKVGEGNAARAASAGARAAQLPVEPKDPEWRELAAKAGKTAGDLRLEVIAPSASGGGGSVVASLICTNPKATAWSANYSGLKTGRSATDYRVLVRDDKGNAVRPLDPAKPAPAEQSRQGHSDARLGPGASFRSQNGLT